MSVHKNLKAEEIRDKLMSLGLTEQEVAQIKGKTALSDKLSELEDDQSIFDNMEPVLVEPVIKNTIVSAVEATPESPEWTQYVLEKFTAKELSDGAPNVHGLRRVTELLLGRIINSSVMIIETPKETNQSRAVATHTIDIQTRDGTILTYSDAADAFPGNCLEPYSRHLVAMASTRAEARALRKALKINVTSAEEIVDNSKLPDLDQPISWNPNEKIPETLIIGIDAFCSKHDINVMEYVNSGKGTYDKIEDVSKAEGLKMFKFLNQYQTGNKEIPDAIKGYEDDWRKK